MNERTADEAMSRWWPDKCQWTGNSECAPPFTFNCHEYRPSHVSCEPLLSPPKPLIFDDDRLENIPNIVVFALTDNPQVVLDTFIVECGWYGLSLRQVFRHTSHVMINEPSRIFQVLVGASVLFWYTGNVW